MTQQTISRDLMIAMLSTLDVDQLSSIVVSATLRDRHLPVDTVASMLNLCCTVATLMTPVDRVNTVEKLRRVSDILERDLLQPNDE